MKQRFVHSPRSMPIASLAVGAPDIAGEVVSALACNPPQVKGGPGITTIKRAIVLTAVWLVLAGTTFEAIAVGVVLAPLALALSLKLLPAGTPVRLWPIVRLVPHFVIQSLSGGIDVARRAFAPRVPLDPDWIAIDIDLPQGGRVALGSELSLMPGTLSAGTSEGRMFVHVLDRSQDVESAIRDEERRLRLAIRRSDGKEATV